MSQALHLLNGSTVTGKIASGGLIKKLLEAGKTPEQVMDSLYIRCLGRRPSPEELERLKGVVAGAGSPQQGLEDVMWAVLNSREMLFNH